MPTPPGNARKLSDLYDAFSDFTGKSPQATDIRDLIATVSLRQPNVITAALSPYSAVETDGLIKVDASGGPVTINLPAITIMAKLDTIVKKIDASANAVTIATLDGSTIDGASSITLTTQWQASRLLCDSLNWLTW
jgi:hypothetical protein